jgi:hypothetical protein
MGTVNFKLLTQTVSQIIQCILAVETHLVVAQELRYKFGYLEHGNVLPNARAGAMAELIKALASWIQTTMYGMYHITTTYSETCTIHRC